MPSIAWTRRARRSRRERLLPVELHEPLLKGDLLVAPEGQAIRQAVLVGVLELQDLPFELAELVAQLRNLELEELERVDRLVRAQPGVALDHQLHEFVGDRRRDLGVPRAERNGEGGGAVSRPIRVEPDALDRRARPDVVGDVLVREIRLVGVELEALRQGEKGRPRHHLELDQAELVAHVEGRRGAGELGRDLRRLDQELGLGPVDRRQHLRSLVSENRDERRRDHEKGKTAHEDRQVKADVDMAHFRLSRQNLVVEMPECRKVCWISCALAIRPPLTLKCEGGRGGSPL